MRIISIHTDAAFKENVGFACGLRIDRSYGSTQFHSFFYRHTGKVRNSTQAEIISAIKAMDLALKENVDVIELTYDAMVLSDILKKDNSKRPLFAKWVSVIRMAEKRGIKLTFQHVHGHSQHYKNNQAHYMATWGLQQSKYAQRGHFVWDDKLPVLLTKIRRQKKAYLGHMRASLLPSHPLYYHITTHAWPSTCMIPRESAPVRIYYRHSRQKTHA